eukprot:scaffold14375_cov133-Isochrysis_galbana.AAC.10
MPRLPSALGLGGAKRTGGLDWTLNPPICALTPQTPLTNPLSPMHPPLNQAPAHLAATDWKGGGMDFVHYFSPFNRVGGKGRVNPKLLLGLEGKKPILAFLATGQHGAAELRVGPDGRLSGRAAITKAAARRRAARGTPNGTILGLAVAGQQRQTPSTYALLWSH